MSKGTVGSQHAHTFDFRRVGGAHHQAQLPVQVPGTLRELGDMLVQQRRSGYIGQATRLQVVPTWIGGAAQQECPLPWYLR